MYVKDVLPVFLAFVPVISGNVIFIATAILLKEWKTNTLCKMKFQKIIIKV